MSKAIISRLYHCIIRIPKTQAVFTYCILEANEGLAFYSTLSSSLGRPFRDIEIFAPLPWKEDVLNLLDSLREQYPVEVLEDGEACDARGIGREFLAEFIQDAQ